MIARFTIVALFPTRLIRPLVPNATDLAVAPVALNVAADSVRLFRANVPAVSVNALVEPRVKLSCNWKVPPVPLIVTGKSSVLPFVVIVLVPLVAAKVVTDEPAVNVPPLAGTVKLP